ncbi:hypothetical protein A3B46_03595 [Candidatus Roizmanbacteria bacterium RIFCSPLOWO2_01_FULL_39_19]|nr:MAG: hypothetical protein A3B46_03595 [Candidatus Roizmanbacteria bacterium RIFCSPLOWO2_01_FULL_39_19]
MDIQPETTSVIKKNLALIFVLLLTTAGALIGIRYFLRAESIKIPDGYNVLSYIDALETADRNEDGYINSLDGAYVVKRYGAFRLIADPKFGDAYNSLEVSFQIAHFNKNINIIRGQIFKDPVLSRQYVEDIVVANEKSIATPNYVTDDRSYNEQFPSLRRGITLPIEPIITSENLVAEKLSEVKVLGETTESADTQAGGEATGSRGSDSGRTIIPSVLGTVSSYTGSAGFDYPISVPSGPGGIAPALSLGYASGNVDDALPYDDRQVVDYGDDGHEIQDYFYKNSKSYTPFFAGYGFAVSGGGSIVRDTRQEKDVFVLKGEVHHRFILNLPSGLSAELKYNKQTRRWTSIPEGFVKIDRVGVDTEGKMMPSSDFRIFDGAQWVVTASDGSKYYFGEEKLSDKINIDGRIHGSEDIRAMHKKNNEEVARNKLHHTITTKGGIFNEFDIADLCKGDSTNEPCRSRISNKKPALLVTKWLLRRMETSDGRSINFQYDNYQKYYGDFYGKDWDNKLAFVTTDSYLRSITWNDDKHRVLFLREDRPDRGGNQFLSPARLAKVDVETKLASDNTYHLVRRYQLGYVNDDSVMEEGKNDWQASLVKSIQEFGTDGKTTTPTVIFKYKQYSLNTGTSGSLIYLTNINNGYGGETQYAYEMFNVGMMNGTGDGKTGLRRARVVEKKVADNTSDPVRVTRETYKYGTAVGFADRIRGDKIFGREFLGHDWVEVKTYDFNSDKILAHNLAKFYQFNGKKGNKTVKSNCQNGKCDETILKDVWVCFEPHLNKGRPKQEIVYNQLDSGKEIEANKTTGVYNYRILDWDASGNGYIKEDNLNTDTKECKGTGMTQPYFVYPRSTTTIVAESKSQEFEKTGAMTNLKETPVNERSVKQENLQYDLFGNLLKAVSYGPVNEKGEDITSDDNRYSYGYYLTGNLSWLNNLPYLSYTSESSNCLEGDLQCQFGRSQIWYDQFYGKFSEIDPATQKPSLGLVTQTKNYIETDANRDGKHDDPITTYQGIGYLRLSDDLRDHDNNPNNDTADLRRGGTNITFGPKPNLKNIEKEKVGSQVMTTSKTEYDPYYKTLVTSTQNVLGHKTLADDYDYLLQIPKFTKTQLEKNTDVFSVNKIAFDPLGRITAKFSPDPDKPGWVQGKPSQINTFFDSTTNPGQVALITRQMSLVSQTKDGKFHYMTTDNFYDGLGKIKQTQVLSKKIDGVAKKLVTDAVFNVIGAQLETYELQLAEPVNLPDSDAMPYDRLVKSVAPQLVTIDHRVLSKTTFDGLNRPIQSTVFDVDNNRELTTKNFYYINAQKTLNPKGVAAISTTDSLGRPIDGLVVDPNGDQHTITQNEYTQAMIDKPTKTTYRSTKQLDGGSSAAMEVKYDKAGRVYWSKEPSLNVAEFQYDVLGNIIWSKRGDGSTHDDIGSEYDLLSRLVKTSYYSSGNEELFKGIITDKTDITYAYDDGAGALGKLVSVKHHMGVDMFTYDIAGRQKTVSKTIKDKTYSTTNNYNKLSQLTSVEYPDNHKYEMEYDEEGAAQKTLLNGQSLAASTIFDKFGRAKESQFVLGTNTYVSKTSYDMMGRLKELNFEKKNGDSLIPYFKQKLGYDQYAQLTPLTESTFKDGVEDKTIYNYTYDTFSRLTKAESSKFNTSYSYDPFGRLQTKNEEEPITLAYDSSFPFFAPKAISRPAAVSPTPTPTVPPREPPIENEPTITPEPTTEPTKFPTITSGPTLTPPTPTPASCKFESIIGIKERMSDGTLRPLTTDEAKDFLTINDKRKAKYDSDENDREFWSKFTDGYFKPYPEGGSDYTNRKLCCVDEANELPYAYKVGEDKAYITIKYFGTGSSNFEIVDRYCNNLEEGTGCPANTTDRGGLRDLDYPTTAVPHLPIGCNQRYEYGWIVVKNSGIGALLKKLFPAGRGTATNEGLTGGQRNVFNFNYNNKGAMLEDDKQCYSYNRLNQLIALKIKKDKSQSCNNGEFTKSIYFYYDYAGTLVLQEEYKGQSNDLLKKTYYFGSYEDEYASN